MESEPGRHDDGPGLVGRRQIIAGAGIAAGAWIAPSFLHIDVASAQGSGPTMVTVTPGSVPMDVSVNPNVTDTLNGEAVFGEFGRFNDPANNGDTFTVSFNNPPAHNQIMVTVRICYQDIWEMSGRGADTMDIQVDGNSVAGYPTSNVGANNCIDYTFVQSHSGPLDLTIVGNPVALAEDFGIASIVVEYI